MNILILSFFVTLATFTVVACSLEDPGSLVARDSDKIIGQDITPDYADKNNPVYSMVFIGEDKSNGISLCGGLVVGRRSILTARHCARTGENEILVSFPKRDEPIENKVSKFSRNTKRVKVIDRSYPDKVSFDGHKIYEVSEKGFRSGFRFDMAILNLEEDVPENTPVFDLSKTVTDEDLKSGQLMAFGYNTEKSSEVGIMKGYNINLLRAVDRKVSAKPFAAIKELKAIADLDICLGDDRTVDCRNGVSQKIYGPSVNDIKLSVALENGICEGDSGSPMFVLTADKEYKLVGVTSEAFSPKAWIQVRSTKCSRLGAYQNINPLRLWLAEKIK